MRRLAHRRVIHMEITADGADHDFPGIQPDADLHGHAMAALHLSGVLFHRGLHGQGRIAGPHGMVLMRQGRPKQGHNAIAHDLVHGAFVAVYGRHHAFQHGIENCRASSGSRSARSSMEPLRSANSTVTCLRSPSRALREVKIFSAR